MATVVWPPSLRQSTLMADLREETPDLALRSSVDRGPAKLRLRTLADVTRFTIAQLLTGSQLATFDTFYRDSTDGGTEAFEWIHHRTGNTIDYRFVGPPVSRPLAPRQGASTEYWRVEFTIESIPGTEVVGSSPPPPPPPPPGPGGGDLGYGLLIGDELGGDTGFETEPMIFDVIFEAPAAAPDTFGIFNFMGVEGESNLGVSEEASLNTTITFDAGGPDSGSFSGIEGTPFPGNMP
jgi:hypothetical protein